MLFLFGLNLATSPLTLMQKKCFENFDLNRYILLILYGIEFEKLYFSVKIILFYFHVSFITKA